MKEKLQPKVSLFVDGLSWK